MNSSQTVPPGSSVTASSGIEHLSPTVTREWLFDRQIVVYTLADPRRETVDTWINAFRSDIMNWPADRPFLVIHDFSVKGSASTPYARTRAQELVDMRPEVRGRAAVVLPQSSITIAMIQVFLSRQRKTARTQRAFARREQAIAWLRSPYP
jgi:hypothetical protein